MSPVWNLPAGPAETSIACVSSKISAPLATECPNNTFLGESVKNFWMISIWISELWLPSVVWVATIQPIKGLNRSRAEDKGIPSPLFFSCLTTWVDVSSHLLRPWTDIYTFASLGSQALLELGLNHATGFLGSPVCRWQIVGLLSPHNHVSQLFIMNLLYKGLYTYRYMLMKHRSIVDLRKNWKILLVPTWVL